MSNVREIKQRLDRIAELGNGMKEQLTKLNGPEVKKKVKEQGKKLGAGIGVSIFGLMVACVASLYILAVIILLVNIGLNRPWLSALIVVGGFLIIGGGIVAAGVGMAKPAAKEMSKTTEEVTRELKASSEEMKAEIEKLQELAKVESEARQKQMMELLEQAKFIAPAAGAAYLGYRFIKRKMKRRHEKKAILRVIEVYNESQE
ncbi:MAG: phage holin family protein [Candidatus Geothermincolia bacterium]